jgi:hypothetical protein
MRIHTNNLSKAEVASTLGMPDDVTVHVVSQHGSRTHRIAYEVALRGQSKRHKQAPQTRDDSMPGKAATWEDWGQYLANLYRMDVDLVAGPYTDRADFHKQTKGKFNH